MKKLLIAALFATTVAAPAMAQEAAPFTGPRVEGLIGYDKLKGAGDGRDGLGYGIAAGYDFQLGGAVAGVEAEFADSNTDGCDSNYVVANDRICASARRDLYAGARLGVAVTPSTLLYAKAGYTNARVGVNYTNPANAAQNFSLRDNLDGVRVGAGVEQKLGTNLYVKGEYRYSNYESGFERHQVLGGLGFRF